MKIRGLIVRDGGNLLDTPRHKVTIESPPHLNPHPQQTISFHPQQNNFWFININTKHYEQERSNCNFT